MVQKLETRDRIKCFAGTNLTLDKPGAGECFKCFDHSLASFNVRRCISSNEIGITVKKSYNEISYFYTQNSSTPGYFIIFLSFNGITQVRVGDAILGLAI